MTNEQNEHRGRGNRITNDPVRIEKRKAIAAAFTVPRNHVWVQGEASVDPGWPLITDIHQLYVLRPGAIILGGGSSPEAYRKQHSASGAYWARFDVTIDTQAADITLPATLLHEPEELA